MPNYKNPHHLLDSLFLSGVQGPEKCLPIFYTICSFMTIIYSKSPAGFYKAKTLPGQNHVRTPRLQSFLLSTSYNVHVMSNTIKDRKLQFCGGNNFSMQSRYLSTSVYLFHLLTLFTINVSYVHNVTSSPLDPISQTSSFKTD